MSDESKTFVLPSDKEHKDVASGRGRRERYEFDKTIEPWGTRTTRTWEVEVVFEFASKPVERQVNGLTWHGYDSTFGIIKGGITGHERVYFTKDFVEKSCQNGWWACAGTPARWDGLFIPADEMRRVFGVLGIIEMMGLMGLGQAKEET